MFEPKAILRFAAILVVVFTLLSVPWPGWRRTYAAYFRSYGDFLFAESSLLAPGKARFLELSSPTLFEDLDAITPGTLPRRYKLPEPEDRKDTLAVLMNKDVPQTFGVSATSSIPMGLWPTAMVAGLALATPIRWWRRLIVLAVGLVFAHAFVAVRLTLLLLKNGLADPAKRYHVFAPNERWHAILRGAGEVISDWKIADAVWPPPEAILGRVLKIADVLWRLPEAILRGADEVICDDPTFSFVAPVFLWLVAVFVVQLFGRRAASEGLASEDA